MGKDIKLKHPFEFEGNKINSVTWPKRIKAKSLMKAEAEMIAKGFESAGENTRTMFMVAQVIGQPVDVVEEMDLADYLDLAEKAKSFL